MAEAHREIQELLVDYAGALRDGCLPGLLKSLTREEAKTIASCRQFWEAAEAVRVLNSAGFGDKVVMPDVSLFISRVDAKIASRLKKAKGSSSRRRTTGTKSHGRVENRTGESV